MRKIVLANAITVVYFSIAMLSAPGARADSSMPRVEIPPSVQQECGGCHVVFPPGMLPKASWARIMQGLATHYGTDASSDTATTAAIATWLESNAGTYKRVREVPRDDRITQSAWFVRKHDEVPAAAWKRPAIKSAANCSACHPRAEKGDFNEHDIKIPR